MRAACAIAMVASLLVFTGCCSIGGSGCDNSGGAGHQGTQNGGFFAGGCDSGGCASGGTSSNFSDSDCGPMCGAYLSDGQSSGGGCGCNDCQMGQSYLKSQFKGQVANWFSGMNTRPIGGRLAGAFAPGCGSDGGYVGCDSGDCGSNGGYQSGGGILGSCRGLGSMVGCIGCRECGGGNAIGLNHSDSAGPNATGGVCNGCGVVGCGGGCLKKLIDSRRGRSHHPYGGEVPHTATAAGGPGGPGGGGAAPAYSYPYYTTRGPRDFLMMNPPSIGR